MTVMRTVSSSCKFIIILICRKCIRITWENKCCIRYWNSVAVEVNNLNYFRCDIPIAVCKSNTIYLVGAIIDAFVVFRENIQVCSANQFSTSRICDVTCNINSTDKAQWYATVNIHVLYDLTFPLLKLQHPPPHPTLLPAHERSRVINYFQS